MSLQRRLKSAFRVGLPIRYVDFGDSNEGGSCGIDSNKSTRTFYIRAHHRSFYLTSGGARPPPNIHFNNGLLLGIGGGFGPIGYGLKATRFRRDGSMSVNREVGNAPYSFEFFYPYNA